CRPHTGGATRTRAGVRNLQGRKPRWGWRRSCGEHGGAIAPERQEISGATKETVESGSYGNSHVRFGGPQADQFCSNHLAAALNDREALLSWREDSRERQIRWLLPLWRSPI